MRHIPYFIRIVTALALLASATVQLSSAFAQGTTAFTYQGRLNTGTNAANGSYDMTFAVYDAAVAGNLIAGPITNSAVPVTNGLFTVTLNFGAGVFTGTNYWVQMAVSPAGANTFATLAPNQPLTPAPYALSLVAPQAAALNPAGAVIAFAGPTNNIPNGYLFCDGRTVPTNSYPALFAAIGTAWGNGDGTGATFSLPDMRGVFLRGTDNGRGQDPDVANRTTNPTSGVPDSTVGSYQVDMFASHQHSSFNESGPQQVFSFAPAVTTLNTVAFGSGVGVPNSPGTGFAGGFETRPRNVYVNYIIKY